MAKASSTGSRSANDTGDQRGADEGRFARGATGSERLQSAEEHQREQFGGLRWGSAFFGWLVTVGIAVLLIAILSAAGAAVGLTQASADDATSNAETVGIVIGTLIAAIAGGKAGTHFHRKVDRVGTTH